MSQGIDQRRSARCAVDLFVEELSGDTPTLHPAVDLSEFGIYLLMEDSRKAIDIRRDVHIRFKLPSGPTIETHGRIVHVDDHRGQRGVRIAFRDLADGQSSDLQAFIATQLS